MTAIAELDRIAITVKSHRLLKRLLSENPKLEEIMRNSKNETEALVGVRNWVLEELSGSPRALEYWRGERSGREAFEALRWQDYAAIRLLDYVDNAGREFADLNLRGSLAVSNPIRQIWMAVNNGTGGAKPAFFEDMLHLFRQFTGEEVRRVPAREEVEAWMQRYPSGLDPRIVALRAENRDRILNILIDRLDGKGASHPDFRFAPGMSRSAKLELAQEWWNDARFHLKLAVRSPDVLNEMLGDSLDPDTMKVLRRAKEAGIPFFVNPYYLSLLHVRVPYFAVSADLAMRCYVVYSTQLVEEFGHIVAWEKEDMVRPGEPNAAGWLLPPYDDNVHRRYPSVAILIPDSTGRACGGLCAPCQRMFDFQRGRLNFNLEKLEPPVSWPAKLTELMAYFENDSQLRDILITGGDALMSTDKVVQEMLDAVHRMAAAKRAANANRPDGQKYAEMLRVRLGTRLPAYLPQRITDEMVSILGRFREKGETEGIRQFVIQTHFESPMEVTPESRAAVQKFLDAGWVVTNQHVMSVPSSRRGHAARLRQVLGEIGVLPYYTFAMKGYQENQALYAPIARVVQEELEEKHLGRVRPEFFEKVQALPDEPASIPEKIAGLHDEHGIPFLSTDRSVLNLPAVGKSLTFRTIGITRYGRRILEFDHDPTRPHSPIIDKMGKVIVIESKSIGEYLGELDGIGEDIAEYRDVWGYSVGQTEPRSVIYEYPEYDFAVTPELTNYQTE